MAQKVGQNHLGLDSTTDQTQATSVARQDTFSDFYYVQELLGRCVPCVLRWSKTATTTENVHNQS